MARGVAGGAFSTVRAQEAITLDACRPPLLLSLRGTSCRVAKYRIPPALSPPCRCLGGEESRPPPPPSQPPKTKTLPSIPRIKSCDYAWHRFKYILLSLFFRSRGKKRKENLDWKEGFLLLLCVKIVFSKRNI